MNSEMALDRLLAVLIKARAKIGQGWTQGAFARDAQGAEVEPDSAEAVMFCAAGAYYAVARPREVAQTMDALRSALPAEYSYVTIYNDTFGRRQHEVLALYDRAIENSRREKERERRPGE